MHKYQHIWGWLFGLRWPSSGAYPGSLVRLMADSGRAHAKEYFPEHLLPVSLSPRWDTATPRLCRRPSNTSRCSGDSFGSWSPPPMLLYLCCKDGSCSCPWRLSSVPSSSWACSSLAWWLRLMPAGTSWILLTILQCSSSTLEPFCWKHRHITAQSTLQQKHGCAAALEQ